MMAKEENSIPNNITPNITLIVTVPRIVNDYIFLTRVLKILKITTPLSGYARHSINA